MDYSGAVGMPGPHRWVNLTRKYDPARLTISCMVQFKAPYGVTLNLVNSLNVTEHIPY